MSSLRTRVIADGKLAEPQGLGKLTELEVNLRDELGVSPSDETTQLFRDLI